jgi:hypothetical protein
MCLYWSKLAEGQGTVEDFCENSNKKQVGYCLSKEKGISRNDVFSMENFNFVFSTAHIFIR